MQSWQQRQNKTPFLLPSSLRTLLDLLPNLGLDFLLIDLPCRLTRLALGRLVAFDADGRCTTLADLLLCFFPTSGAVAYFVSDLLVSNGMVPNNMIRGPLTVLKEEHRSMPAAFLAAPRRLVRHPRAVPR